MIYFSSIGDDMVSTGTFDE